jgi:poly(A) polymerase
LQSRSEHIPKCGNFLLSWSVVSQLHKNMPNQSQEQQTTEEGVQASPAVATIFSEAEHPIREHQLDREALKVLYRLRDAGFKGYLVGGGVRDLFLGKQPKDFDISTDARPGQLRRLFRNSRTIGRRFRLVQVFFRGNKIIEVSTLRSRSEYDEGGEGELLASNNTFGTLEEDAFRRDLTINSLFYEIEGRTVIDYVGGVEDLNRGIIRMVGDPDQRFTHDPVRMLRVVRHAARTGFSIDPATSAALRRHSGELMLCPPSRLRDEILKDLRSGASQAWAEQCLATPLWRTLFPFYRHGGKDDQEQGRLALLRILAEMDRVCQSDIEERPVRIDDYFLFAALLLPWASSRFHLPGERLRGPQFHERLTALRDEIDRHFAVPFNVPRMAKERISTLLINLSTLHHAGNGKDHPRWLKRKSYYQDCKRLYALYQLGQGSSVQGVSAEDFSSPVQMQKQKAVEVISAVQGASSSRGRGGGNPAFSSKKSGVFGLRSRRHS